MGKISPVSSKYIIQANIEIQGVVDRPDIIGAIFGQTEGLLGADLELRELQRSGRIGRIEVNSEVKAGKTQGEIIIPSSLDKAETAIVAAALEVIERIGPCNAKIKVVKIEDVRISKRKFMIDRAKTLLKEMVDGIMPDSQELADEVSQSVRVMEIVEYGKTKIPAGPMIDEVDDIIVVEGRADVLNLLKHGFKNAIALGGTGVPPEVAELTKRKETTLFVDGDRGGDLIIKELAEVAEVDFVTKAPDGKEVEELAKKEVHKALRGRMTMEQALLEINTNSDNSSRRPTQRHDRGTPTRTPSRVQTSSDRRTTPSPRTDTRRSSTSQSASSRPTSTTSTPRKKVSEEEKEKFSGMVEDLVGTRAALILDDSLTILGRVPVSELTSTVKSLSSGIYAIIFDGSIDKELVMVCEKSRVKHLIGMDAKTTSPKINIMTTMDL